MANMIIRPAAGTGNKVIVQDQAGAAVLTTADSGATLTAPTITDLSNLSGALPSGVSSGGLIGFRVFTSSGT